MKSSRNIYLKMKTLAEAKQVIRERFFKNPEGAPAVAPESIPVLEAVGRVLARPVNARVSSPHFHAAAMDGVAVSANMTFGASESSPRDLALGTEAVFVNTGHVLPDFANAVIMIEHVQELDGGRIRIEAPVFPWQNVRKMGEDIVATELLFPRSHRITPYSLGALIAGGVFEVDVWPRPRVMIIPTGSELVDWRDTAPEALQPGQVLESNSFVLGKLVEEAGGNFVRHSIIGDQPAKIQEAVREAVENGFQIVMIVGGSSAGSEDYARTVISGIGEVLVHGVTMMPGKPVVIGVCQGRPVVGMPGYPVSAILAFEELVAPILKRLLQEPSVDRPCARVVPAKKIPSKLGMEEFVRVKLGQVGERIVATPLPRGAGSITTLTEADGVLRIPEHVEGLPEGEPVEAELLRPLGSIRNTLVVVGSHDNSLDILADQLRLTHPGLTLSSSHVGSMGGLLAIRRGMCHLAGTHLLDTSDGSYNISYLHKYLPHMEVRLVHLAMRDQGLIVPRGNPKNIKGIEDLVREDVTFINRQGGSGTRILLDYRLRELGIDPAAIRGYPNEEFTHMTVSAAVLSGAADVGLGIFAAARALGLDFVPVVTEQYDLAVPQVYYETENVALLMSTLLSSAFRSRVEDLGGYNTARTGEVLL